jgi:mannose/fructose/N-acetylgalactosamine-specific phosphotransferase system component IIC
MKAASRWPKWLKRGPLEMAACAVIAIGIAMMLQPFALVLFTSWPKSASRISTRRLPISWR